MAGIKSSKDRSLSKSKPQRTAGNILRFIFSWHFVRGLLLTLGLGALFFLYKTITEIIIRALGFGVILIVLWLVLLAFVLRKRRFSSFKKYYNYWIGTMVLTGAAIGIMGIFHPNISIFDVSLADVSLSGSLGHLIKGGSFSWLRLLALILLGVVIMFPQRSLIVSRYLGEKAAYQGIRLAIIITHGLRYLLFTLFTFLLITAPKYLWGLLAPLFDGQHIEREMPSKKQPVKKAVRSETVSYDDESQVDEVTEPEIEPPLLINKQSKLPGFDIKFPLVKFFSEAQKTGFAQANDDERAKLIEDALGSYGVEVQVKQVNPGPSVTQFGVEPGWVRKFKRVVIKDQNGKPILEKDGNPKVNMQEVSKTRVKVERITALSNDLALALAVPDIRIEAPVPGKAMVGIEVPNASTAVVSLRYVMENPVYEKLTVKSRLAIALGQGAGGDAVAGDLAKMPHLLIAGATGSGKTVCLNCIITCLLAQTLPSDVRLMLIDPKRVELVTFTGVPHLLTPVIVDVDKAIEGLRRVTIEMENRYKAFATAGARNIDTYNRLPSTTNRFPYIVVLIDELADLMMTAPDVVEPLICRLAQLSRATGIHLVVATQRPSVDVITGLIKANFPTRISFAVVSSIDSRTILDATGAEKLLGRGDMLYLPPEAHKPKRIRGCYVSDEDMEKLVTFWREWAVKNFPLENDTIALEFASISVSEAGIDPMMEKARELCEETSNVSISLLQRKLHIGYQRAARLADQLEEEGLIESRGQKSPWEGEP